MDRLRPVMLKNFVAGLLIAAMVLLSSTLLARGWRQENAVQQPNSPTFRANVREVLVPVVVTDQKAHYVTDLKASDFKILEDGVPQDLVSVSSSTDPALAQLLNAAPVFRDAAPLLPNVAPTSSQAPTGIQRTYLLCVDTLHSAFGNFSSVRDAISKVLAHENGEDSRYGLLTIGKEIRIEQQPTSNASQVAATARSREFTKAIQDSETANMSFLVRQFKELMQRYCTNCACSATGKNADSPACSLYKGQVRGALVSFGERESVLTRDFLSQLQQLVRAAAAIPGARTVVLISDGFNRFPGRELYAIMQAYGPQDSSMRINPRDTGTEMEGVLRLATEYNIAFYTLDSRGLYTAASTPGSGQDASTPFSSPTLNDSGSASTQSVAMGSLAADRELLMVAHENTDGMAMLARATGGLFFENNNDLAKGLRTALEDGHRYYVLAYVSKNNAPDGKYRKIDVQVNGGKNVRITAKAGYWAEKE